ncbi:MAG: glycerol kinase GlpK [Spirochaetales bacterium]|nr:glycerol kinase GlpK [Spirochaetales bacterium]
MKEKYVGAIDQGTTSTRFILFNHDGREAASHQVEHKQIFPQPGWVEHDPLEIWENTCLVIREAMKKAGLTASDIVSIGITNQRETTLVWDKNTGKPLYNALVWQDTRTAGLIEEYTARIGQDGLRKRTGLPLATYFSGPKLAWLLKNVPGLSEKVDAGDVLFGTTDTWLIWNLTRTESGIIENTDSHIAGGGVHVTDITNAGRTMLMDLASLAWEDELLEFFGISASMLPEIRASVAAKPYGFTTKEGPFGGEVPICGILGDQQAAMFGQACFEAGTSKNTYGTGCFFLSNTGTEIVQSEHGLLTTPLYKEGTEPAVFALEGSIAVAGSLVQWVRDNMKMIDASPQIEELAMKEKDSGGVYIVPAFSGLFAPYWRPDARGVVTGLTGYANASHLARAVLESTAFQTRDIIIAMEKDSGIKVHSLKVDGGMTMNNLLMQFQSDLLDIPVIRPVVTETTALGAAYAAGLSAGFWSSKEEIARQWAQDKMWSPSMASEVRDKKCRFWAKAVERTLNWED